MAMKRWRQAAGVAAPGPALAMVVLAVIACEVASPAAATPLPSATGLTVTATRAPSPSRTPSPAPTVEPSATPNPFGTPIASIPWPETGNLSQPVDIQAKFEASLRDLPAGTYILEEDRPSGGLKYTSLDGSVSGMLFRFEPRYSVGLFVGAAGISTKVAGYFHWRPRQEYVIDLVVPKVLKLGPLCNDLPGWPSPGAVWDASVCYSDGEEIGSEAALEIISLEDGSAYHFTWPKVAQDIEDGYVRWMTDDELVLARSWWGNLCLVSISHLGMRCPEGLSSGARGAVRVSPRWLLSGSWPPYSVYSTECFQEETRCEEVFRLSDEQFWSNLEWSPDGTMLGVDIGSPVTSDVAEIGYYDTETWTYHMLTRLPRSHGLFAWCPDSSCMIIVGETSYLAYPDRPLYLEPLPFKIENPLAVIQVP